jgi:hypothetical protein
VSRHRADREHAAARAGQLGGGGRELRHRTLHDGAIADRDRRLRRQRPERFEQQTVVRSIYPLPVYKANPNVPPR